MAWTVPEPRSPVTTTPLGSRATSHGIVNPSASTSTSTSGPGGSGVSGAREPSESVLDPTGPPPGIMLCALAVSGSATVAAAATASADTVRESAVRGVAEPGRVVVGADAPGAEGRGVGERGTVTPGSGTAGGLGHPLSSNLFGYPGPRCRISGGSCDVRGGSCDARSSGGRPDPD